MITVILIIAAGWVGFSLAIGLVALIVKIGAFEDTLDDFLAGEPPAPLAPPTPTPPPVTYARPPQLRSVPTASSPPREAPRSRPLRVDGRAGRPAPGARDERAARDQLYGRTGNIIPLPLGDRSRG